MAYSCKFIDLAEFDALVEQGIVKDMVTASSKALDITKNYDYREAEYKDYKTTTQYTPSEIAALTDDQKVTHWEVQLSAYAEDNNINATDKANKKKYLLQCSEGSKILTLTGVYYDSSEKSFNICIGIGVNDANDSRAYYFSEAYNKKRVALAKTLGATKQVGWLFPDSGLKDTLAGSRNGMTYNQLHSVFKYDTIQVENISMQYKYVMPEHKSLPTQDGGGDETIAEHTVHDYTVELIKHTIDYV